MKIHKTNGDVIVDCSDYSNMKDVVEKAVENFVNRQNVNMRNACLQSMPIEGVSSVDVNNNRGQQK